MKPSRRILCQIFTLFDEQHRGSLSGDQFLNLVRALVSVKNGGTILSVETPEVTSAAREIASRVRVRTENYLSYDEFVDATIRYQAPFEPFFAEMKNFFAEQHFNTLNELFPFTPTYEYQTLYDWQSVPPNCESILPLSDTSLQSTNPLACFGTKHARISEECQYSLMISEGDGDSILMDPVRVRVKRSHTVGELLQTAVEGWPGHYRPAPPTAHLKLVWHQSPGREVVLSVECTVEQAGLFFIHRDCRIHTTPSGGCPSPSPNGSGADIKQTRQPLQHQKVEADGPHHHHRSPKPKKHSSHAHSHNHRHSHHQHEHEHVHEHEQPSLEPKPQPPSRSTGHSSAQLLVSRLGREFSLLREQIQSESLRISSLLQCWEDALTLHRDQLPPDEGAWEDGSVLSESDGRALRIQAAELKADLKSLQGCVGGLHCNSGDKQATGVD